jgi:hypothetical protein
MMPLDDLNRIKQFVRVAHDLDELDKLMRYQTTLQRQLSTITGELLALTK